MFKIGDDVETISNTTDVMTGYARGIVSKGCRKPLDAPCYDDPPGVKSCWIKIEYCDKYPKGYYLCFANFQLRLTNAEE